MSAWVCGSKGKMAGGRGGAGFVGARRDACAAPAARRGRARLLGDPATDDVHRRASLDKLARAAAALSEAPAITMVAGPALCHASSTPYSAAAAQGRGEYLAGRVREAGRGAGAAAAAATAATAPPCAPPYPHPVPPAGYCVGRGGGSHFLPHKFPQLAEFALQMPARCDICASLDAAAGSQQYARTRPGV